MNVKLPFPARAGLAILASLNAAPASAITNACVSDTAGLQLALTAAASDGQDNNIALERGVYHLGGNRLLFNSSEGHSVKIEGGFGPGCATRIRDAALTVLDGDNSSPIFNVTTNNDFELHFLTLQHGYVSGSSGGAMAVFGTGSATSQALLANLIIRDSASDFGVGGVAFSVAGTVALYDNLITGISAPGGAVSVGSDTTYTVQLTNNTVVGNTATDAGAAGIVYVGASATSVPMNTSNNIFWNNVGGVPDMSFVDGAILLTDNDYQRIDAAPAGGSSGNQSVNPQFLGSADFHLASTSPLLGIGTLVPPGGLGAYDLEGHARVWNSAVDLGSYERGDEIFSEGFDL